MLWLHYIKGWGPEEFRGSVFERKFGVDTTRALAAAREIYDQPTIERWMQDQEAKASREDAKSGLQGAAMLGSSARSA